MKKQMHYLLPVIVVMLLRAAETSAADRWPEWRGAGGQGHADAIHLPVNWSETKNVVWKRPLPGLGWSTPVVENGQIWVTTAVDKRAGKADAERRRKMSTNSQPLIISDSVSLKLIGIDFKTGKIIREQELFTEQEPQMIHYQNSYATPTPILDQGKLYCHYGPYGIAAVDIKTGKTLWTNRSLRVKHENGPGSSPVLWDDLLIIHCDGIDQQYIVALDKQEGKIKWKTKRTGELNSNPQLRKSYCTPLIIQVNGNPQVISPAADWLYGYDPATGKELWKLNYGQIGFSNAPRPVANDNFIYICTGFFKSQLFTVRLADLSGSQQPKIAWQYKKQVPNVSSPLLINDELYFVSDAGIASCLDAQSGKIHWVKRIGKSFWASPLYADGKIYFFAKDGTTTVIKPGTNFKKLATNSLPGIMNSTAAAIDHALILRTDKALYRIGLAEN